MKRQLIFIMLLMINSVILCSQPSIEWQQTIGGNSSDYLYSISQTLDGGYILGGYSNSDMSGDKTENSNGVSDYWIIKLDAAGNIEWQNTIGGSGFERLNSIMQTQDGGYIIAGHSDSELSGDKTENSRGNFDYWVVKLNEGGVIEWEKTIGGNAREQLNSIVQTNDGGYILGGHSASNISGDKTENSNGGNDYWVVKIDGVGNIEWQKTIGGSLADNLVSIVASSDGGYLLCGNSISSTSGDKTENSNGGVDYWIVKIDGVGNIEWQNTIGGSANEQLYSVVQTTDGKIVLGGYSDSNISGDKTENSNGGFDYWVIKLEDEGNIEWQKTIGGNDFDALRSIDQTNDGGFLLGGLSNSNMSGDKIENSKGLTDYWIVKLDEQGNIEWQNTIGGDNFDTLTSIFQSDDGSYLSGGYSKSNISGDKTEDSNGGDDYWMIKLSSEVLAVEDGFFANSIDVYPNPTKDILNIKSEAAIKYELLDQTGSILFESNNSRVQLKSLSAGMFYLRIYDAKHNLLGVKKVMKE